MVFGNCDVWGEHTGDFYRMQRQRRFQSTPGIA